MPRHRFAACWVWGMCVGGGAFAPGSARAQDVGEIAIIPDNSMILDSALFATRYLERASCAFYETHADRYDALFVFTSKDLNPLTRTQQGWSVKRAAQGIGREGWPDSSARFCTARLRHAVKMGDIDSFQDDPDALYTGAASFTLSGIQLMGHEFGHHWLASIRFDLGDGILHCLARAYVPSDAESSSQATATLCDGHPLFDFNQHWSYFFNSGSVMYGNEIRDLGGGQFELTNPDPKYGPLDQYLMGLRGPTEVPPMFLIDVGDGDLVDSAAYPLSPGQTDVRSGTRIDFTIEDVIRAEGPRIPARDTCHWKGAFVIVHPPAIPPTAAQIARVDRYRRRWESFYASATDGRGSFDTTLVGTGGGTAACPAHAPSTADGGASVPEDSAARPIEPPAIDAGVEDEIPDAGSPSEEPTPAPAGDMPRSRTPKRPEEPRVIGLDESCDCTSDRAGSNLGVGGAAWGLFALVLLAFARSHRGSKRSLRVARARAALHAPRLVARERVRWSQSFRPFASRITTSHRS